MERTVTRSRYGNTLGTGSKRSRKGGIRSDERSGDEAVERVAGLGVAGDAASAGDWRFVLMRELYGFMAFVTTCERGAAPSVRQHASCMQRLDALTVAVGEQPGRGNGRYEVGGHTESALSGGVKGGRLRPREIEALGWRHEGLLPKEIAREMGISLLTVRSYIRDASSKLDASGWEAAVRRAIELGLL